MENSKKQNIIVALIYFAVILILCSPIIFGRGLPLQYDWAWPLFSTKYFFWNQLKQFDGLMSLSSKYSLLLFSVVGYILRSPKIMLALFIFCVHFTAAYSFYKFCKNFTATFISFLAGLAYAFTAYIFIRTIVGFGFSLIAYAATPIFLNYYFFKKDKKYYNYLLLGLLLSLIFAQIQSGILISLVLFVGLLASLFYRQFNGNIKFFIYTFLGYLIINLPWLFWLKFSHGNNSFPTGDSVTTLVAMGDRPHSYRAMLMLSDHDTTSSILYPLSHEKFILVGFLIVWAICLCSLFSKKNRQLVLAFFISSLLVVPFYKGPTGHFGSFFVWFYNHFPQIMIFRETYHFEFLFAITLCILFAVGLDLVWQKIAKLKPKRNSGEWVKTALRTLFVGSFLFIISPYLTFNYVGSNPLRPIPSDYNQLYNYLIENKNVCQKIYYPPGLNFVYFKGDTMPGASNSDIVATSIPVPFLDGGTSVLNTPSQQMFYQNELVSQFYKESDNGEFASLLNQGGIDCVVVRQDMDSKYYQAMNLHYENDPTIVKHWNQNDWLSMTKSKAGLKLEKQFGDNIYIYKVDPSFKASSTNYDPEVSKPATDQFSDTTAIQLPLTDWADNYSYYKDGWSRGRYDFWRNILFARLGQDFIYTDKANNVLTGKIDYNGNYELWARYLTGGTTGNVQISVNSNQFQITKDSGEEKFVWQKLGDIQLNGSTNVTIKNISGENAIADLVLVKK